MHEEQEVAPEGTKLHPWVTKGGCRTAKEAVVASCAGGQLTGHAQSTAWSWAKGPEDMGPATEG